MEERSGRLPSLLVLTWVLSFCLTLFSIELRAIYGRGILWTLPVIAAACLAIVNWSHFRWKSEYLTISLVWNLVPMTAAGASNFMLGFALGHKLAALLLASKWFLACMACVIIIRRENRLIREHEEWAKSKDEEFAKLDPVQIPARIWSEHEALSTAMARRTRSLAPVLAVSVVLLLFGVVLFLVHH